MKLERSQVGGLLLLLALLLIFLLVRYWVLLVRAANEVCTIE